MNFLNSENKCSPSGSLGYSQTSEVFEGDESENEILIAVRKLGIRWFKFE